MKLLLPFLVSFNILMGHALQECPTSSGWSPAETICYRIVHYPESFWAAKAWCKAVEGELLSLENVAQVEKQVGKSMQGNAGDYRIDGWADGQWFQKDNQSLVSEEHELLAALDEKTLTVNLQDWQVDGETEMRTRLGFICEGKPEDLSGTCKQEPATSTTKTTTTTTTTTTTSVEVTAPEYTVEPAGCYNSLGTTSQGEQMTVGVSPKACAKTCARWKQSILTAADRHDTCFCLSAAPPQGGLKAIGDCDRPCVVDTGLFCGGDGEGGRDSSLYSVYRTKLL